MREREREEEEERKEVRLRVNGAREKEEGSGGTESGMAEPGGVAIPGLRLVESGVMARKGFRGWVPDDGFYP